MNRKLLTLVGLLLGLGLLLFSLYLYISSGKRVFSSEDMKINAPETAVTKRIALRENDNPHEIFLKVDYEVTKATKKDTYTLFSYGATLINGRGEVVEHKNSSYNFNTRRELEKNKKLTGTKSDTITLFTFKDLPTDTYALSIDINPTEEPDSSVVLNTFSYMIKKDAITIPIVLPITGLVLTIVSFLFMPRGKKHEEYKEKAQE